MVEEPSRYRGLYGDDFLKKAREGEDKSVFEAIWRLQDSGVSGMAAEPLASFDVPDLSGLLLKGILEGPLGPGVVEEIREAIRKHYPRLDQDDRSKLVTWLGENEPAGPGPAEHEVLEVWLLRQVGDEGDSLAEEVLCGRLSYQPSDTCIAESLNRCQKAPSLAERIATKIEAQIVENGDGATWALGADLLRGMSAEKSPPTYLRPLSDRLLTTAPELYLQEEFSEPLGRYFVALSAPTLKKMLAGEALPNSPGARALVLLNEGLRHPMERAKSFANLASAQSVLWDSVSQRTFALWDSAEWTRRLSSLDRSVLSYEEGSLMEIIEAAPADQAGGLVPLVTGLAAGPEDIMIPAAAAKLSSFLAPPPPTDETDEALPATIQDVPWWPAGYSSNGLVVFDLLLRGAIKDPSDRIRQITRAVGESTIDASEAARFVDVSEFELLLNHLGAGALRSEVAGALSDIDPDGLSATVQTIHDSRGFQIDLARAASPYSPERAFFAAGLAYSSLNDEERSELLTLLEEFATSANIDVLDAIVQDTHKDNSDYRRRAALCIGRITPERAPLPPSVVELLQSNRPELVAAAATVIGHVKPENEDLVRLLRSVALNSEEPSKAKSALRSLAEAFVAQLTDDPPKEKRVHLLRLLASAATPEVVESLLSHVGLDALDDDPDVRRTAASGLREVASQGSIGPDSLARLVALTEEERDPGARDELNTAVSQASLGEDAALDLLQEMIGFKPAGDLRQLLGQEKESVVRHLELLATQQQRGKQGWPMVIMQLDLVAERVLRVAYLKVGKSEKLREQIRNSPTTPDYGSLIQALANVSTLQGVQGQLKTLHDLRSKKTEFAHIGEAPDENDVATANNCFTTALKTLIGIIGK